MESHARLSLVFSNRTLNKFKLGKLMRSEMEKTESVVFGWRCK